MKSVREAIEVPLLMKKIVKKHVKKFKRPQWDRKICVKAPVLFQGIGHTLNAANNLVLKVLSASPSAYSARQNTKLSTPPSLTGTAISLVSVVQARNNARVLISGLLNLFSNRLLKTSVWKAGSATKHDKSGNEQFVTELSKWVFHERGHLKAVNVRHHKVGETAQPTIYRINDDVEYSVEIYEWSGTSWEPYVADDVQIQFYMMSLYVLKVLSTDKKGLYSTTFKVPDVYGVFQFKVEYQRLGYTGLSLSKQRRLLDILDKVAPDDILVILSVAKLCDKVCQRLLTECIDIVIKSNIDDFVSLEKALSEDVVKHIMDSRTDLGMGDNEINMFPDKHVRRINRALDLVDVELVRMLLKEGHTTLDHSHALHYTGAYCDAKTTTELLDLGIADVNHKSQRGYSVLHVSAMRKEPKIIVSLLTKGARPADLTSDRRKALQISKRLTKAVEAVAYYRSTEEGKASPKDRLCIEILEQAERRDPLLGEASVSLAMVGDDLRMKLLYLENRVCLAKLLFPMEAKVTMDIAQVDDTLEFPLYSNSKKLSGGKMTSMNLNEATFGIEEEHLNRMLALSDQLSIAKETCRRLGMGTNMYPSSSLVGRNRDENEAVPVDELIENADGFAGVFPEHKYEIVKILQEKKHICGMTGDGVNDAPALKKADIGIAVSDATDAARSASDIVLTEPGLSVIISAVLTSHAIFQRMKNYTVQGLQPSMERDDSGYRNTLEGLTSIVREQEYRQLFAGLSMNYMKIVSLVASGFTAYDMMKSWLRVPPRQKSRSVSAA